MFIFKIGKIQQFNYLEKITTNVFIYLPGFFLGLYTNFSTFLKIGITYCILISGLFFSLKISQIVFLMAEPFSHNQSMISVLMSSVFTGIHFVSWKHAFSCVLNFKNICKLLLQVVLTRASSVMSQQLNHKRG